MLWDRLRARWLKAAHESAPQLATFTVDRRTHVRLDRPTLRYADLAALIAQLRTAGIVDRCAEFAFDFSRVEQIEAPWTPVFAALFDLCRRSGTRCVITGLHGQPGAMAELVFGRRRLAHIEVVEQSAAA